MLLDPGEPTMCYDIYGESVSPAFAYEIPDNASLSPETTKHPVEPIFDMTSCMWELIESINCPNL